MNWCHEQNLQPRSEKSTENNIPEQLPLEANSVGANNIGTWKKLMPNLYSIIKIYFVIMLKYLIIARVKLYLSISTETTNNHLQVIKRTTIKNWLSIRVLCKNYK